ncbi:MAG: MarR family transcriptional regulator [Verrucomicrobiota bacterium]
MNETLSTTGFPPLLRSAWFSLNQAFRQRLLAQNKNLTPNQFTVLRWLTEHPDGSLSQKDMTNLMTSDANTIASLMNRMEKDGLLTRKPHPNDQRCNMLSITEKGAQCYQGIIPLAEKLKGEITASLTPEEIAQFEKLLKKIAAASLKAVKNNS